MVATAALCLAGCAIDVDLASTPSAAKVGEPIDFDISVRNRFSCPVGGVVALLVPFVPKNTFINQIDDPGLREALSEFVAAFCGGEDVFPPDGSGGCRIEAGELICELDPGIDLPGALPEAAVATTPGGDDITCRGDGEKIVCRFPRAVVDLAMAQQAVSENSLGSLQCAEAGEFAICAAALLDPNETKSSEVRFDVPYGGVLRNWVVSFATVRGGVCTGGLLKRRRVPRHGQHLRHWAVRGRGPRGIRLRHRRRLRRGRGLLDVRPARRRRTAARRRRVHDHVRAGLDGAGGVPVGPGRPHRRARRCWRRHGAPTGLVAAPARPLSGAPPRRGLAHRAASGRRDGERRIPP
jgi:hypothetical protein